ncbi:sialic acid-binding Ig-like lectin 7 isoform X1 [Oncorhynchus kisutch]|uniref:sialic acid-binding Ig-like lectin 7 isoform X1 n=1 Tax=Oncorhynchus kisutch TaxID=8019 RepID=UPI0012DD894D|nr:sialic acid-binding Ig-like lectin 7 isoform X1 [Oncorhynchus kisutch]XP_031652679.1 sialic acid-binding Ig-like lectin 7 isoform X1 [Oncorhynchus kisutch]XP_031652680.1 sialic acid-binding Ig-like lectin 7 isoform X1 [Oncorhynchus kisutch]XP_031652681.1 sialic acid-binding Ig-like lectin 7 isoform X1 [Oncorhynchus kisutch]XP_031652682.1 sialic acid-binding Ig-like lectin 7 isoform X1 [Oncorhynchus kisutch]XP_031652683.1 sialic acid-binding Ig-like lectin 7 isoform X1 [Oncorhynchus kisutch]
MACPENMFFLIVLFISGVLACFGKRDLITTMPDRLDVLAGSCVQIPCSFDIPDQHKDKFNSTILTSGVWIKENLNFRERPDNVIFNSSKMVNRYQGEITGNISQKNCTTVFFNVTTNYTDKYYLRIESQPYRATDPDKSVEIDVSDLPSSPIITVSGEVKEGTPVSLNCSAVTPCPEHPPELTWTLPTQFTSENQLQENSDQTKSVLSTVTFTPSYLHHEKNITCTAVYPVGTSNKKAEHNMMLNVSFSPKDTSASISPADSVSVGSCVNLTCSSTANPPVTNFTWFQISGGKRTQVASGQSYTLNVTVGDGGLYYCEARNSQGCSKSNEVQLDIKGQKEPKNPMVFGVAAGTLGAILLISLISLFVWGRNSRLHDGLERTDSPQGQNSPVGTVCTNQATAGEEPEKPAEDQPEEIHYGAIDFSKRQTKETPAAAQDRVQGQESEYAEVNVTGRGAQEPPLNNLDGLYAQVNKISAC